MASIDLIVPNLRVGGFEKVRVLMANQFASQGHNVRMVLMQADGDLLAQLDARIEVIDLNAPRGRHALLSLAKHFRASPPDAVLAGLWPLTFIVALARLLSGKRFRLLLTEQNQLSRQYAGRGILHAFMLRITLAIAHRLSSASVGVSRGVADDVAALAFIAPRKMGVVLNPVEMPEMSGKQTHAGKHILTVGSLKKQKRHDVLLRAFAKLGEADCTLTIVGGGAMLSDLRALTAQLDIAHRVVFAGQQADTAPFYASADLFVLSSDYEGMPNVLNEALSFGVPVVSTDCPSGPREILDGGKYGQLVPIGDADALAKAMQKTLTNPIDSAVLCGRVSELTPDKIAAQYLALLLGDPALKHQRIP